jgi:hypothetical protein
LIHGFSTGRWSLTDFFNWAKKGADTNDETKDQVESYKDRAKENAEDKEKYESL